MNDVRINSISQEILHACLSAEDAVACLYVELDGLRATGDWSEIELRRLQVLLLDTAKGIADRPATELPYEANLPTRSDV